MVTALGRPGSSGYCDMARQVRLRLAYATYTRGMPTYTPGDVAYRVVIHSLSVDVKIGSAASRRVFQPRPGVRTSRNSPLAPGALWGASRPHLMIEGASAIGAVCMQLSLLHTSHHQLPRVCSVRSVVITLRGSGHQKASYSKSGAAG
jgi:hypothetical protein